VLGYLPSFLLSFLPSRLLLVLEFELRALHLAKQVLCHLNHTSWCWVFFFEVWFELRASGRQAVYHSKHSASLFFFFLGIFKIGRHQLFACGGFEL
jgi:hypothetical protein